MKVNYIAIEREYGSGGTQIARKAAEACQIPCYGSEILSAVAQKYNISAEEIEQYEENAISSFLYSLYTLSRIQTGNPQPLTAEGQVFLAQQKEIKRMAAGGRAIFLGHCAAESLKEYKGTVKIFIRCSDAEAKRKRITEEYGISPADAEATRKHFDKKRSSYYYSNTSKKWNDFSEYDMVLDSGTLGIEGCVGAIKGIVEAG